MDRLKTAPYGKTTDNAVAPHLTLSAMDVAVIGGGRWGKVLCKTLARSDHVGTVHVVSRRNLRGMHEWLADQAASSQIVVHDNINDLLDRPQIRAAFVANLPAEHFATSKQLLEHGKHVLVEKPFVATSAQAITLIELAEARGLV
ncbi:MAG: Gfo/Idh/MocA family protein, partial [Pyrinomonadaceae bacterium]